MKAPWFIVLLGWAYLSVVLHTGLAHHHDRANAASDHQCSACLWQAKAISDTPVVAAVSPGDYQSLQSIDFQSTFVPPVFSPVTASRGPPSSSC